MILVTGAAGFIGFHTCSLLLKNNYQVIGIDNINDYYDRKLKIDRIKILKNNKNFFFKRIDISNYKKLEIFFSKHKFTTIIHLAAQAGVRYSFTHPHIYESSNIVGFKNILDSIIKHKVKFLLYASSSSVYGNNINPRGADENDDTSNPLSFYAYTKKNNELLARYYSHTYNFKAVGLRFFTVYGPYGRPDMSLFKFVSSIIKNKKIDVYNHGKHMRDFTYIDDIINFIYLLFKNKNKIKSKHEIFNLSRGQSRKLMDFIRIIEKELGKKAKINFKPIQKGDVTETKSSNKKIRKYTGYTPRISIEKGIKNFINWYINYYKIF